MSIMLGKTSVVDLHGPLTDFMDKLQGNDGEAWFLGFKRFLRKENPWDTKATIEVVDGVTRITVTSDGRTNEDFIRTWDKHYHTRDSAKDITRRAGFTPTTGVIYRIPIIMGVEFSDNERITSKVREEAAHRHYRTLPFEAACLLREAVSDEDLKRFGLWWFVGMHHSIKGSDNNLHILGVDRSGDGRWVDAYNDGPGFRWLRETGFAFLAPQD